MIAELRGTLRRSDPEALVVDVGGVGFRVFVPSSIHPQLPPLGSQVSLYTSLQVREDMLALYGFPTVDEYESFELLLTVSGIGPRVAMGILSATTPAALRRAILFDDLKALTQLPGVGKKTAQRLILELKEKLGSVEAVDLAEAPATGGGPAEVTAEAADYLLALGYSRPEATQAIEAARAAGAAGVEELVRQGLRRLAQGGPKR